MFYIDDINFIIFSLFHLTTLFVSDKLTMHSVFPYGLVVRIPAFHVGGPGSIPGVGTQFLFRQSNPFYNLLGAVHICFMSPI